MEGSKDSHEARDTLFIVQLPSTIVNLELFWHEARQNTQELVRALLDNAVDNFRPARLPCRLQVFKKRLREFTSGADRAPGAELVARLKRTADDAPLFFIAHAASLSTSKPLRRKCVLAAST